MLALHKKIYKTLENGPMTNEEIFKTMPDEKRTSIRAIITLHPELFVRLGFGVIGRKNRDEHMAILYRGAKDIPTTEQLIKCYLSTGPKTLQEVIEKFPDVKEERVINILSSDVAINKNSGGIYLLTHSK